MTRLVPLTLAAALLVAAPSSAATKAPDVRTGGAAQVAQTSATLTGSVNPNGLHTTYYFEIGPGVNRYTTNTGPTDAGAGTKGVAAAAGLTGLAPATKYHYRLVATNAKGATRGADRSFTTAKQPLGFTLAATPNPVSYGGAVTLTGQLTGTGNAGHGVKLQLKSFPYTSAWTDATSELVTDAQGNFSATIPNLLVNTQFQAITTDKQPVASAAVIVGSAVRVSLRLRHTRVRAGRKAQFSGFVTPIEDGALLYLQRSKKGTWINVASGSVRHGSATVSRYIKSIRARHAGLYRVVVGVNNQNTSGISNTVRLRVIPRPRRHH